MKLRFFKKKFGRNYNWFSSLMAVCVTLGLRTDFCVLPWSLLSPVKLVFGMFILGYTIQHGSLMYINCI